MHHQAKSIRPFLGAKNYEVSRAFYRDLGFQENVISDTMSYFCYDELGFYLQKAYVQDWIDNTMVFMEVVDINLFWNQLLALNLNSKYENVKLVPIVTLDWGKEFFVHDPSGILWHFGAFVK